MLERTQTHALPLLNKGVELSPAVQACCGVCRSCLTTNVLMLVTAAASGAGLWLVRLVRGARDAEHSSLPD
jgi:hypothetical protein